MRTLTRILGAACMLMLAACSSSDPVGAAGAPVPCVPVDATAQPALAADGRPQTIPALREWQAGDGIYRLCRQSRVLIAPESADRLRPVAEVFAEDYARQTGRSLGIAVGAPQAARAGDFSLSLGDSEPQLGTEGYRMTVGETVVISAREPAGAFYATVSVLQLLKQTPAIAYGEALDWPRYAERGLMVDNGRHFFPPDWLHRHIRELAWLKLNYLHLHFTDNEGWRIESAQHPEIVSQEHLTKAEVRELIALAARYHITVVPEIDMPGHMGAALAPHPEFQLTATDGSKAPRNLDITDPAAVQFARELIEEYLPLFPGRYWHSGGEEYIASQDYAKYPQLQAHAQAHYGPNATGKDAVLGFINDINDLVRSHGKSDRVWHDGISGGSAVTANPNLIVEWWTDFNPLGDLLPPSPQAFIDRGHEVVNASFWPTYYTVGAAAGFPEGLPPRADTCSFYEGWEARQFLGPLNAPGVLCLTAHVLPPKAVAADEPRLRGSKLHVWNDTPGAESDEEIAAGIAPRLRIMAQKTWNSAPLTARYAEFEAIMASIGRAPGFEMR